jgi:hypothetical protein
MLAFTLIMTRFGAAESQGSDLSANAVATLRDFVVAGLTCTAGEDR